MSNEVTLVEVHQISSRHRDYDELDHLCFLSKNLYNSTLYAVRQHYIKRGKYLSYYDVNKIFTHSRQVDYVALPAKVSKATQMLVHRSFLSFFAALRAKSGRKVRLPKYLGKNSRQVVHYEKGALSFKRDGYIRLSKTNVYIKTNLTKNEVQFVRVTPKGNHINVEVGFKRDTPPKRENCHNIASVDFGLSNLLAVVSNTGEPLIVNGKPLKSINQHYNKRRAQIQSVLEKRNGKRRSRQLDALSRKRHNRVNDYVHKSVNLLMNYLVSHNIDVLVVGYSSGMKQNINLGRRNNQNFVGIPFLKIIQTIQYKCDLLGIHVEIQEESYTSKASFLDDDKIPVFSENRNEKHSFSGRRIKRGLYKASNGRCVNADVNGALNILKKYALAQNSKVAWNSQLRGDLVQVCSSPDIQAKTPSR